MSTACASSRSSRTTARCAPAPDSSRPRRASCPTPRRARTSRRPSTLIWRTDPVDTAAVHRWLLEAWPPEDLRGEDTEPIGRQLVKGDKRRATVRLPIDEDELAEGALLVIRVTALDADGQPVRLRDGAEAVEESQQFAVRWEAEPVVTGGRRATSRSLPQARLARGGRGTERPRRGRPRLERRRVLRAAGRQADRAARAEPRACRAPAPRARRARSRGGVGGRGPAGRGAGVRPVPARARTLPYGLAERRRRLFDRLRERHPREVVETLDWAAHDGELREEVSAYCQSYRRALDAAAPESRAALLALDTLTLNVATAGHSSIGAVLVLPLHPMRLAWAAEHDATLSAWAAELKKLGRESARRRQSVDLALVNRVTPANLPFAVYGSRDPRSSTSRRRRSAPASTCTPARPNREPPCRPSSTCSGLDRRDVTPDIPPALIAERISAYRAAHPGQDALAADHLQRGLGRASGASAARGGAAQPGRGRRACAPHRPGSRSAPTAGAPRTPIPSRRSPTSNAAAPRRRCAAPVPT